MGDWLGCTGKVQLKSDLGHIEGYYMETELPEGQNLGATVVHRNCNVTSSSKRIWLAFSCAFPFGTFCPLLTTIREVKHNVLEQFFFGGPLSIPLPLGAVRSLEGVVCCAPKSLGAW